MKTQCERNIKNVAYVKSEQAFNDILRGLLKINESKIPRAKHVCLNVIEKAVVNILLTAR